MLGELVGIATSGRPMPPLVFRAMRALFDQLARPETVAELVRIVEESGDTLSREHLGTLLGYFPPESLGPLLRAGEGSASETARAALLNAAERLAAPNPAALRAFVQDADPSIAAGAARLVGRLRVSEAGPDVARLLTRPEARVRVAAIDALQELRSPAASGALEAVLEDEEREVRVAAARALAALRWAPARARLEAALDSKRLREADLTERIAFFEAYGQLAGAEAVGVLDRILNGKSWLGRRESGEMRACAALGLGRVRHPGAEKSLAAAAADPDPVVRSAVGRALRSLKT
jgi:HEAT repeat protein